MFSAANRKELTPIIDLLDHLANGALPESLKDDAQILKSLLQADSAPIADVKESVRVVSELVKSNQFLEQ